MTLKEFFVHNPEVAVAVSGGVDSAYLLHAAAQWAKRVRAYCASSAFQPRFELDTAQLLAGNAGVPLTFLQLDILSFPAVTANGSDRCYHCKKAIFGALCQKARENGLPLVIDGTNASDDAGDRPGMRALRELGVRSPLRECGLGKQDIRALAKEAGLPVWDRPSYACLATRPAAGQVLTKELLQRIEQAENEMFSLGFSDFRVRVRGEDALLQLPAGQLPEARENWPRIRELLERYFAHAMLDEQPRKSL